MKHLEYDTTRRKALAAFKEGDWQLTASLYESMSDQLTAVERKRLSIARKRLA
jgi:hypothetical protein